MFYVYELRDPRNGQVFYVGKGQGDRAYQHQREVLNGTAKTNPAKIAKIQEILAADMQVEVAIVAEYVYEEDALDHEFHLVEANPTLTNVMPGGASGMKISELYLAKSRYARLCNVCKQLERMIDEIVKSAKNAADAPVDALEKQLARDRKTLSERHRKEIEEWRAQIAVKVVTETFQYKNRRLRKPVTKTAERVEGAASQSVENRLKRLKARLKRARDMRNSAESNLIAKRKEKQALRAALAA
jgi:uncharacterized protein YdcH (DUF465 family)